jgi:hypothetical protein
MAVASEAITLIGSLRYIRGRRFDRALELLEGQVDLCVESLSVLSTEIESLAAAKGESEILMGALRQIRDYRRDHPRRDEADLSIIDKKTVTAIRALQARVREILEELE